VQRLPNSRKQDLLRLSSQFHHLPIYQPHDISMPNNSIRSILKPKNQRHSATRHNGDLITKPRVTTNIAEISFRCFGESSFFPRSNTCKSRKPILEMVKELDVVVVYIPWGRGVVLDALRRPIFLAEGSEERILSHVRPLIGLFH
jgi:hypothetical protein